MDTRALRRGRLLFYLCAFLLLASILLGGGTRPGFLSDVILQFLSIPLFVVATWNLFEVPRNGAAKRALWFCLAVLLVPLLQLIPLPPALWTRLPGHAPSVEVFVLLQHEFPWMPISMSPHLTWLSALSLVPPLSIFVGVYLLSYRERRLISLVILGLGVVSVFLGLLQIAQGPESALRFFEFTNSTDAVGFFANRNHFSAFLYSLILFVAAWIAALSSTIRIGDRKALETPWIVSLLAAFAVLVVFVAAQAMTRSRAGLGLTIFALFGAFALSVSGRKGASGLFTAKPLFAAMVLGGMLAVQFALYRFMERFATDPLKDGRIRFARNTIEAALAYMPFGSGMGTFVPVYGMFEKPEDAMVDAYANHAHDDFLELWLEAGVPGLVLIGLFAYWFAVRSIRLWRYSPPLAGAEIDRYLPRAAALVVILIIAHSFVDYPLRTGALMAIFAFSCALLLEPPVREETRDALRIRERVQVGRNVSSTERLLAPATPPSPQANTPAKPAKAPLSEPSDREEVNIDWPDEWRKPPDRR